MKNNLNFNNCLLSGSNVIIAIIMKVGTQSPSSMQFLWDKDAGVFLLCLGLYNNTFSLRLTKIIELQFPSQVSTSSCLPLSMCALLIYMLIYGSFNEPVSNSDYIAWIYYEY
jgi:hypothetical protein